ncbi:MAG: putative DNA-binding domain-containing protein [Gemmatimonadetes bacterium]|nr:putative DNA-binding domain-containing protein [Gemmatimonadota bacterium]
MPLLAEVQAQIRRAVVAGDPTGVAPLLVGGRDARQRLAIHRRHYETSLVTALLGKFPATVWLVGSAFTTEAARHFVRDHPPRKPCIAEYGDEFPRFLASRPAAERVPYLGAFAELEWRVGQVSVAVDRPPLTIQAMSHIDLDDLADSVLTVQPGLRYIEAPWPVDALLQLYLTDSAPNELAFAPEEVRMEIRGARGAFHLTRLDAVEFMFRRAVAEGRPVGDAAEGALAANAVFAPGLSLATLVAEGAVTGIRRARTGGES